MFTAEIVRVLLSAMGVVASATTDVTSQSSLSAWSSSGIDYWGAVSDDDNGWTCRRNVEVRGEGMHAKTPGALMELSGWVHPPPGAELYIFKTTEPELAIDEATIEFRLSTPHGKGSFDVTVTKRLEFSLHRLATRVADQLSFDSVVHSQSVPIQRIAPTRGVSERILSPISHIPLRNLRSGEVITFDFLVPDDTGVALKQLEISELRLESGVNVPFLESKAVEKGFQLVWQDEQQVFVAYFVFWDVLALEGFQSPLMWLHDDGGPVDTFQNTLRFRTPLAEARYRVWRGDNPREVDRRALLDLATVLATKGFTVRQAIRMRQLDEAESEARAVLDMAVDAGSASMWKYMALLGEVLILKGDYEQAEPFCLMAVEHARGSISEKDANVLQAARQCLELYTAWKLDDPDMRSDEVKRWRSVVESLQPKDDGEDS